MGNPPFTNISSYKFIALINLEQLQESLLNFCHSINVKGTILLGHEGINLMIAGPRDAIDAFTQHLTADARFSDMVFKESLSNAIPFRRMRVRLKKEIVTLKQNDVDPTALTGRYISPQALKKWLDEQKDFILLDTRNDYEVEIGTFDKAETLGIHHFSEFPDAMKTAPFDKSKTLVMFCTGGIRCEKASNILLKQGYDNVYQLDGGILKYFEECNNAHYKGDCFVFDQRTALDRNLQETGLKQCPRCDHFVFPEEQNNPHFVEWNRCQYCTDKQLGHTANTDSDDRQP